MYLWRVHKSQMPRTLLTVTILSYVFFFCFVFVLFFFLFFFVFFVVAVVFFFLLLFFCCCFFCFFITFWLECYKSGNALLHAFQFFLTTPWSPKPNCLSPWLNAPILYKLLILMSGCIFVYADAKLHLSATLIGTRTISLTAYLKEAIIG